MQTMSAVDPAEAEEFTYTLQAAGTPRGWRLSAGPLRRARWWLLTSSSRERPLTSQSGESVIGYTP